MPVIPSSFVSFFSNPYTVLPYLLLEIISSIIIYYNQAAVTIFLLDNIKQL